MVVAYHKTLILFFFKKMMILYALLAVLGILTSYTDLKHNIVKNSHLLIFTTIGAILLGSDTFIDILIVTMITTILCFFLYLLKILAPGDAKLLIVYIFLIPLSSYEKYYFKPYPPLALFISIFIIASIAIIILNIPVILKQHKNIVQYITSTRFFTSILSAFASIIAFSWIIHAALATIQPAIPVTFSYIISLILLRGITTILPSKNVIRISMGTIIFVRIMIQGFENIITLSMISLIILMVFLQLIIRFANKYFITSLPKDQLQQYFQLSTGERIKHITPTQDTYTVKQTVPFAPLIFLGVMITIITKSQAAAWFADLLRVLF